MDRPDWLRGAKLAPPYYLDIADRIGQAIEEGRLHADDRLPPQRSVARLLGVDLTTVTRAYREATARGLIKAEVGRGTFVRGRTPSRVINLTLNLPPPLPGALAREAMQLAANVMRRRVNTLVEYSDPTPAYREAGVEWLRRARVSASADRVVLSAGAQNGLALVAAMLRAHAPVVLTERLTYPHWISVARTFGLKLVPIDLDEEGAVPESLARAARRERAGAVYLIPSYQNPTAAMMSEERRDRMAAAIAKAKLLLIEDDVYGPLAERRPTPVSERIPEQSIYIASLSKAVAPGLRIAYMHAGSAELASRLNSSVRALNWIASPLGAPIATSLIETGLAFRMADARRLAARQRFAITRKILGRTVTGAHPAYHAWLRMPKGVRSVEFAAAAAARGVILPPGSFFSVGAVEEGVRICTGAAAGMPDLTEALTQIATLLGEDLRDRSLL